MFFLKHGVYGLSIGIKIGDLEWPWTG